MGSSQPRGGVGTNGYAVKGSPKQRGRSRAAVHVGSFQEAVAASAGPNAPQPAGLALAPKDAQQLSEILHSGKTPSPGVAQHFKARLRNIYDSPRDGALFDDDCADFMIAVLEDREDDYGRSQDALLDATVRGLEASLFDDSGSVGAHANVQSAMAQGFSFQQATFVTGMGERRNPDCLPVDTAANKLAAGALSPGGVKEVTRKADLPTAKVPAVSGRAASSLSREEQGSVRPMVPHQTLDQIGNDTLISVSGTRLDRTTNDEGRTTSILLPVNREVAVEVFLAANDTYTVRHTRNGGVLREATGVYAEDLCSAVVDAADSGSDFGS